jgi:hypothetical protein
MKATNANQKIARRMAARHDTGSCAKSRELREENARRVAAANKPKGRAYTWLMHDVSSTPYAEYRA